MGKEGRAAVRSADFAFAKFRHLQRVFLVHGHWFYVRTANLVQYFFYKNLLAFMMTQFYFACFNRFSSQSIYDAINLALFNIVFTSVPILAYGLFEQNIPQTELLENPKLYKQNAKNRLLQVDQTLLWLVEGLFQSTVVFFAFYFLLSDSTGFKSDMSSLEMTSFGVSVFTAIIIIANLRLLLHAKFWNVILVIVVFLSIAVYFGFT